MDSLSWKSGFSYPTTCSKNIKSRLRFNSMHLVFLFMLLSQWFLYSSTCILFLVASSGRILRPIAGKINKWNNFLFMWMRGLEVGISFPFSILGVVGLGMVSWIPIPWFNRLWNELTLWKWLSHSHSLVGENRGKQKKKN